METGETMKERADFHVHYTDKTAREIINQAKAGQVMVLGLVGRAEYSSQILEYMKYGEDLGIKVLPGVEYKARLDGGSVDLICLDFDPQNSEIANYFAENAEKQQEINKSVAQKEKEFLGSQGFDFQKLNEEDRQILEGLLKGEHAEKAIKFCRIAVNANEDKIKELRDLHSSIWKEVVEKHGIKPWYQNDPKGLDAKFLYELYFANETKPGYQYAIAPYITPVEKIIKATHKAGGVVLYSPEGKFDEVIWQKLIDSGIDGIMAWHANRIELPKSLMAIIRKSGLLILGGGDYDPTRNHWQIGTGDESNSMFINPKRYSELLEYKNRHGLNNE